MNKKITFWPALLTGIGMVIGSGIFFKSDDILRLSNGNVTSAIIGWIVFGVSLIFAGISVSIVAQHTSAEGGSIGYIKEIFGETAGFIAGWFESVIYLPVLIALLGIVGATFFYQLLGYDINNISPLMVSGLGLFFIVVTFVFNYLSTRFAALFSSFATIVKLLPIVIIGVVGILNFKPEIIQSGAQSFNYDDFTAPLLSMSFAFSGWIIVASMSRDMENPQRDMAKILALNAIIITIAYVVYFTGITMLMPVDEILQLKDAHVGVIANNIFGAYGEKLILFCVVMSVLGTLNGKIMGGYRYPHALAKQNDLPFSSFFVKESRFKTTGNAAIFTFIITIIWWLLYTLQAVALYNASPDDVANSSYMFSGITFDDIPIMLVSFEAIVLIGASIIIARKYKLGLFKTLIMPIIGIVGQVYVIISFVNTNEQWLKYSILSIFIILLGVGLRYLAKRMDKSKEKVVV